MEFGITEGARRRIHPRKPELNGAVFQPAELAERIAIPGLAIGAASLWIPPMLRPGPIRLPGNEAAEAERAEGCARKPGVEGTARQSLHGGGTPRHDRRVRRLCHGSLASAAAHNASRASMSLPKAYDQERTRAVKTDDLNFFVSDPLFQ